MRGDGALRRLEALRRALRRALEPPVRDEPRRPALRQRLRANLAALDYTGPEETFNIGTGTETSVLDLLAACQDAAGTAVSPQHEPARLGELARSALDCRRAARELGWRAEVGFGDGLAATLAAIEA